jgi:glycerol-3-phosphate dehydrogenase
MSPRVSSRRIIYYSSAIVTASIAGLYAASNAQRRSLAEQKSYVLPRDTDGALILPKFPHIKTRTEQIAALKRHCAADASRSNSQKKEDQAYDLLVIGGGATGAGIALDAATRGLKVALVERDDFASGTSSRSTKLVHGGVRYLEKAVWNLDYDQYELVKEALRERSNFLHAAPHLTSWLPVMLPLKHWWQLPYFFAGTKCYDLLAGSEANPSSYYMPRRKAIEAFPMLKKNLVGALVYYDGQQNDSRMNVLLALTAALYGATTVNHLEVIKLERDAQGRLCGARVRDLVHNDNDSTNEPQEFIVRAKGIINATGPFADAIQQMDEPRARDIISPSSGVHITLPAHFAPQNMGLLDPSTSDGRVLFMLPWQGTTLAGTTDAPCQISNDPQATERDIDWILKEVRKHLAPEVSLERRDVLAAWSGIRPLVRDPDAKNTESLVRSHLVSVSKSGLLTCAGGKWTTYRQMAEDAVDKAIEVFNLSPKALEKIPNISGLPYIHEPVTLTGTCQTQQLRLIGAHGYSPTLHINLIQRFNLDPDIATHLATSYGDRAWEVASLAPGNINTRLSPQYPLIEAEIRYAVSREYAQTAVDVLARRTRLSFMDAQAALEALPSVIEVMGRELRWSKDRKEREWTQTVRFLGTMGLPTNLMGFTKEDVLSGRMGQGFVPRKGRGTVEGQKMAVADVPVPLPAFDDEVVQ